jgi:hypothetical protein
VLPPGWLERTRPAFEGAAIVLLTLGREDFLRTKVFALCDRGLDIVDCVALAPTAAELEAIRPWLELQDGNPGWPAHVGETLADLGRRLGHGA